MGERLTSKEKKCPKCGSEDVERTGGSGQVKGYGKQVGFKCNQCHTDFGIFDSDLKP